MASGHVGVKCSQHPNSSGTRGNGAKATVRSHFTLVTLVRAAITFIKR